MPYKNKILQSTYYSYKAMIRRCYDKNHDYYDSYGGKSLGVCHSWKISFHNFVSDMGIKPEKGYSIDRIDNSKGYFPENCKWSTKCEQNRNKSNVKIYEHNGLKVTLPQLAREYGISVTTLRNRLKSGKSLNDSLSVKNER